MSDMTSNPFAWPPARRNRHRGCLLVLVLGVVAALAGFFFIYRSYNPYDEVVVTIIGLPVGSTHVCVIADGPRGPEALMTYSHSWCNSMANHPDAYLYFTANMNPFADRFKWINSSRTGALYRSKDGEWLVAWFNPPKNRAKYGSFSAGRGSWTVNWTDADEVRPISEDQMRAMGFVRFLLTRVNVHDVPKETNYACMIADTKEGLKVMQPSRSSRPNKALVPMAQQSTTYMDEVDWIESDRIGLLQQRDNGQWRVEWRIAWFDLPKGNKNGASLDIKYQDAKEEQPVTAEQLRAMGFVDALR
jgi:hypothetical protein